MVKPIWDSISRWCNVHVSLARSQDLLELSCSVGLASVFTKTFDAILRITSWVIWKHRNEKIFKNKDMSTNVVVTEIKALSHLWIHSRSRGNIASWNDWVLNPWCRSSLS
ncbi:RNA-directed DNA polymerase, eukaryota, Reverse transcriptase zinc-binding domain protein [Artemisia annua]|uniref:RNA-directed DNA polymerase, eukaryota, Reverse transcriptase zinc-binding domain protein n=1 Tax=Artemisia annua TaxID=35608 RepID=A0A2U1KPN6_ARTAN|nr:RNA-directed DNA polymerase, eukaryota, Reverse transcriptase zinc-binding domain protein [Artemisia annua]